MCDDSIERSCLVSVGVFVHCILGGGIPAIVSNYAAAAGGRAQNLSVAAAKANEAAARRKPQMKPSVPKQAGGKFCVIHSLLCLSYSCGRRINRDGKKAAGSSGGDDDERPVRNE